jgi:hypothetical protein
MRPRLDGVSAFRAGCGLWFIASPWLLGRGLDLPGAVELAAGLAMLGIAAFAERFVGLRIAQLAIGFGVALAGLLLDNTYAQTEASGS